MRRWIAIGFALTCLAQIAVPAWMLARHLRTLDEGTAFRFRLAPVDPVDAFRGRYVALSFAESTTPAPDDRSIVSGQTVYAVIEENAEGFARFTKVLAAPPEDVPYLRTRVRTGWHGRVQLDVPFDRYYMNETLAPEAERAYRERAGGEPLEAFAVVRVLSGYATLEELYLGDLPVREYLKQATEATRD